MKVTAQLYGQFLLSSQVNYTGTYLADHLADLQHDNVQYFLKTSRFTPRQLWQQVRAEFVGSARGYVLFDDTVLDKRHSQRIELVRRQYSGNAHTVIKGIGLVNCVYVNPEIEQFWLLDYRLFTPEVDGKSKLDHVADMLSQLAERQIPYRTVLMDSWYATTTLFKDLEKRGKYFYCPLKMRFKHLGATAWSMTPAASSPTSRWPCSPGRRRTWRRASWSKSGGCPRTRS